MYTPKHNEWTDRGEIVAFMRINSFATVVTNGSHGLEAQHIPLLTDDDGAMLYGHVALGNPLWREKEALAIIQGPHAYVSASWYDEPDSAPSWNYLSVHLRCRLTPLEDPQVVRKLFVRLGKTYEGEEAKKWWAGLSSQGYEHKSKAVKWLRFDVLDMQAKAKLSQNRKPEARKRVIAALREGGSHDQRAIADAMETWTAREESVST